MSTILLTISILLTLTAALGCGYHLFWATIGLCTTGTERSRKPRIIQNAVNRFAIVIPAHNEESVLATTLRSCQFLDYPKQLYTIFVIADNCTDQTAEVAQSFGVKYFERSNSNQRGKGHALSWALPRVMQGKIDETQNTHETFDAIIILDADCKLDLQALRCMDEQIQQGAEAVQLNDVVWNPEASSTSFLLAAANKLENDYFYAPKSLFHAAVLFRGTGMAMRCELLKQFPWTACSIVEDIEYSLELLENGVEIRFIPEAKVISKFPTEPKTLAAQRSRWIGGTIGFSLLHGLRLLLIGLIKRQWRVADTGITLLTLSRPLIMTQLAFAWIFSTAVGLLFPQPITPQLLILLMITTIAYMVYAALGVFMVGRHAWKLKNLIQLPINIFRYLAIATKSMFNARNSQWQKNHR